MNKILISILFVLLVYSATFLQAEKPFGNIRNSMNNILNANDSMPKGWKQLERGAAFWERRLDENRNMTSPKYIYNEAKTFLDNQLNKNKNHNHFLANPKWELLGPTIAAMNYGNGKVNCVYASPINSDLLFLGSASGGLWRSNDAGANWEVIEWTDFISNGIMDIAISPSHPNIIYATSGDPYGVYLFKSYSLGILKSVDGGDNWELLMETLDFADSLAFFEIIVHPTNPDIVITTTNKYILKSTDGGISWTEVLSDGYFRDMKFMPDNPNVVYATSMTKWAEGGAKIFMSKNCGDTWEEIIDFPMARRIELAVTPQNPYSLYALTGYYSTDRGAEGLYKFNFAEEPFAIDTIFNIEDIRDTSNPNSSRYSYAVVRQSFHNLTIGVSPIDSNVIIIGGVNCGMTIDGGKTWRSVSTGHADHHDIKFIDTFVYICQDGGVDKVGYNELIKNRSFNDRSNGLAITQYYRVGSHQYIDKMLLGGSQDNGTHLLKDSRWSHIGGGDGMGCQFHPLIPERRIISTQRNSWGISNEIFPWVSTFKYTNHSKDTFLIIGENVYEIWRQIDTINGVTFNNTYNNKLSDFFPWDWYDFDCRALNYSKSDKNYIYAARGEYLYMTDNYGETWKDIITTTAAISCIYVSEDNPELFWFSCQGNVREDKVYKYENGVITNLAYNLPNLAVNSVVFYPVDSSLFIGTDMGVMRLRNGSEEWELFSEGMPYTSVMDLEYTKQTGYLYAATWGRGMWAIKLDECNIPKPEINFPNDTTICVNQFPIIAYIKNKEPGYKYVWSNGETDDVLVINYAGEYYLCAESPMGCGGVSARINVVQNRYNNVATLLTRNPVCIGDTVRYRVNAGFANAPFIWSNGSRERTVELTEPTALYITFENETTCQNTFFIDSVKFVAPAIEKPTITKIGNLLLCETPANNYEWYIDGVFQTGINRNYMYIEKPGKYELIIRDANYCFEHSDAIIINAPPDTSSIITGNIYPNPSSNVVIMELFYSGNDMINISFYDGVGAFIKEYDTKINRYLHTEFNFEAMAVGVYYIVARIKDYQRTFRVVIER